MVSKTQKHNKKVRIGKYTKTVNAVFGITVPQKAAETFVAIINYIHEYGHHPLLWQLAAALGLKKATVAAREKTLLMKKILSKGDDRRKRKVLGRAVLSKQLAGFALLLEDFIGSGQIKIPEEMKSRRKKLAAVVEALADQAGIEHTVEEIEKFIVALEARDLLRARDGQLVFHPTNWPPLVLIMAELSTNGQPGYEIPSDLLG